MRYLTIIIFISYGCAGTLEEYRGKGGPFRIEKSGESTLYDVFILSIRDSGYIAVRSKDAGANEFERAFFLHRDSVKEMFHLGLSGLGPGSLYGTIAGSVIWGSVAYFTYKNSWPIIIGLRPYFTISAALLGGILGGFIGGVITSPQSKFDLDKPYDREQLIYLCKYCGHEPIEILNVN